MVFILLYLYFYLSVLISISLVCSYIVVCPMSISFSPDQTLCGRRTILVTMSSISRVQDNKMHDITLTIPTSIFTFHGIEITIEEASKYIDVATILILSATVRFYFSTSLCVYVEKMSRKAERSRKRNTKKKRKEK